MPVPYEQNIDTPRRRIYLLLEAGHSGKPAAVACDWAMILLIVANVAAAILVTVESLRFQYAEAFNTFEVFSVAIFTVEYLIRLWVCVEHP